MKKMLFGLAMLVGGLFVGFGRTQDSALEPEYKILTLKVDFSPDPVVVDVLAGGEIKTKLGGFEHFVAKKPDIRLNYSAGKFPLTIYAQSEENTTLLIRLPDGSWVGNDDGAGAGHNPVMKFAMPQTGRYDIWVGAHDGVKTPAAKVFFTELKN